MKQITEWLNKRPATKAAYFAAFTGIFTLIVVIIQTIILYRQTNLIDRQTKITESQSKLLSNQIEASTRPFIEIKIVSDNRGKDTLLVENKGQYAICNLQINQIYFAKISEHGWYAGLPSNPIYSATIQPKNKWKLDISTFANMYKSPPLANSFIPKIELEYLNILVSFEREIDGKSYLTILPGTIVRTESGIERWADGTGISGPLGRICNPGLELTFEYLKRRPFPTDYELYNSNYTLGYTPTGCLGNIEWIK